MGPALGTGGHCGCHGLGSVSSGRALGLFTPMVEMKPVLEGAEAGCFPAVHGAWLVVVSPRCLLYPQFPIEQKGY